MEEKQIHDELTSIRNLMERSSKFISLSGLSGILAGVYALIGAGVAYYLYLRPLSAMMDRFSNGLPPTNYGSLWINYDPDYISRISTMLLGIASIVLIASLSTGIFLTNRKAKKNNQPIWSNTSRALLFHMVVPLTTAGILILILIYRGHYGLTAPVSLIFYGMALFSASSYTFSMVKYLGLCEIILGLIAACLPGYGLLFWAIGFGVLHIIYGSLMYIKYDR